MSETPATPVNCGRCARLWKRTRPGFGICGCAARRQATGEINPPVPLDSTCEFALLSAKLDPDFMPEIYRQRRAGISQVSLIPADFVPLPEQYDAEFTP